MATRRDSQRSKFYNWLRKNTNVFQKGSVDFSNTTFIINNLSTRFGLGPPDYRYRKSRYMISGYTISLPYQDLTWHDISTIMGWWVYTHRKSTLNEGWHGAVFCRVWAEVYSFLSGASVDSIIDSMVAAGLKVDGVSTPMGARAKKKYEKLKNRVQELDSAIIRGRQEFEEFLQPILAELKKASDELANFESKNT